ncbi:hypothetical protein [Winogradskyella arenosi]|uniref:Tetratricopeptide repeat protein n=1 Tax=Winogradskyella arenosi TaxID=533325 RepID=A0A368ZEH0_9FLAO|nr:hypothetical protein [Winogradskyella arenosi]RCW91650.1 hypothetical protein DFQ08_103486 [Winogradskyella arenosi]
MYYFLIIALQVYCFYHAHKNRKPFYWYFVVFFIPAFGSLIYILTQVNGRNPQGQIKEEPTTVINPVKRIKTLEAQLKFIDTYANRIDLADAYYANGDYNSAIMHYEKTLEDTVQDESYARKKLILCYFQIGEFQKVLAEAEFLKTKTDFKGSKQQFCYGLALSELGKPEAAEAELKTIDRPFSNYAERLELAKFYISQQKLDEAKTLLQDMASESKSLTKPNRKLYGSTIAEVERLLATL